MIRTASALQRHRDLVRSRMSKGSDAGIALLSAILFMVVMAGLAVVLLTVILAQLVPAATAEKRTQTVNAAEAGVEATLGVIRSVALPANTLGKVYGDLTDLPCSVTGKVDGSTSTLTYATTVRYFTSDPTNQSEAWLNSNKMACSATSGLTSQPRFAVITSKGDGGGVLGVASTTAGNRAVSAIYQFKVSNVNIPGGRIYDSTSRFCLQAESAAAGSKIKFVTAANCTNDALQLWSYGTDYEIKLASTIAGGAAGLCITGPAKNNGKNEDALLQKCLGSTDANRWSQLWSWTGDYSWRGQNQNIATGPSNYCLSPGNGDNSDFTGDYMQVRTSCLGTFLPSAKVGAGSAGYGSRQIVNYKEFGRCADVTNETVSSSFMITYPCKQDPTGTGNYLVWNHKWFYTEPLTGATTAPAQQIFVYPGNNLADQYCLQTPSSGTGMIYPTFARCTTGVTQKWTRTTSTANYAGSYLFVDTYGRCLTADSSVLFNGYSRISVLACDGSTAQKWNAPAVATDATIGGYREGTP